MRIQPIPSLGLLLLLALAVACTDAGRDEQQEDAASISNLDDGQEPSAGVDGPSFEDSPETDQANAERDVLARFEECELPGEVETRIREAAEELDERRRRYSEQHPEVLVARRLLEELEQAALTDCVDSLQ